MMDKWKLKKGDEVVVHTGRDKGKTGQIKQVIRKKNRVVVAGVNVYMRHQKPTAAYPEGGRIPTERSIHVSNVGCVDPVSKKPTRIGFRFVASNNQTDPQKVRYAKRSGDVIR